MKSRQTVGKQLDLLTYSQAEAAGKLGMTRAVEHADAVEANWSSAAFAALSDFAERTQEFTAEEARKGAHDAGLPLPPDGRAWGAVFKRAASCGLLCRVGYAPRRCGNMTPTIVWLRRKAMTA